jgi:threonine dehydrogenase-like Zn-dependent dehydrogenase
VGNQPDSVELPISLVTVKELTVLGSFRSVHVMQPALDLADSGRLDLDPVISGVYEFGKLPEALSAAVAKNRVIKIQVDQGGR